MHGGVGSRSEVKRTCGRPKRRKKMNVTQKAAKWLAAVSSTKWRSWLFSLFVRRSLDIVLNSVNGGLRYSSVGVVTDWATHWEIAVRDTYKC